MKHAPWLACMSTLFTTVLPLPIARAASGRPTFEWIEPLPGGWQSEARGVSADGNVVVGCTYYATGSRSQAFRWVEGTTTGLGDLWDGNQTSSAVAVSADGSVVVGNAVNNSSGAHRGFRWIGGTMTALDLLPGGLSCEALGMSDDASVIVGSGSTATEGKAVRWVNGAIGILEGGGCAGISADGNVIVGSIYTPSPSASHAAVWNGSQWAALADVAGKPSTYSVEALTASANGAVKVGYYASEPCRWAGGSAVLLGTLPGSIGRGGRASDVSADGSVIVGWADAGSSDSDYFEAFIWDSSNGMRRLQDVLASDFGVDMSHASLKEAYGVSSDGKTIVGRGLDSGTLKAWICRLGQPITYSLTIQMQGQGSVQRNPDTTTYDAGTVVALTATPASGWRFSAWSGDATGRELSTSVTMNGNKNVMATFVADASTIPEITPTTYALTVNIVGEGSVARDPDATTYSTETSVSLTEHPADGWHFSQWSGAASGTESTVWVTMNADRSVTAEFEEDSIVAPRTSACGFGAAATLSCGLALYFLRRRVARGFARDQ